MKQFRNYQVRFSIIGLMTIVVLSQGFLAARAQQPRGNPTRNPSPVPPPLEYRNLVVTNLEATGAPTIVNGSVQLPLKVVVKNIGNLGTGKFKVSIEYTRPGDGGAYTGVPFAVPGLDAWFPVTNSLAPGAAINFEGTATLPRRLGGVKIRAVADSCFGDGGMPAYCRVQELNERDNSRVIRRVLP
jgi:hypothetical protein